MKTAVKRITLDKATLKKLHAVRTGVRAGAGAGRSNPRTATRATPGRTCGTDCASVSHNYSLPM